LASAGMPLVLELPLSAYVAFHYPGSCYYYLQ
jgi:hypothetical protein